MSSLHNLRFYSNQKNKFLFASGKQEDLTLYKLENLLLNTKTLVLE